MLLLRDMPPARTITLLRDHGLFMQPFKALAMIDGENIINFLRIAIIEGQQHRGDRHNRLHKLVDVFDELRKDYV